MFIFTKVVHAKAEIIWDKWIFDRNKKKLYTKIKYIYIYEKNKLRSGWYDLGDTRTITEKALSVNFISHSQKWKIIFENNWSFINLNL